MATKKTPVSSARTEWVGGMAATPGYTGEDTPYQPELLLWMIPGGPVVGTSTAKTTEALLETAAEHLASTIDKPMVPGIRPPTRVRVASSDLATRLRREHPQLEIVCEPTPELDELVASMHDDLEDGSESDADPERIAAFFRAAAILFRAKPWDVVPEAGLLSLSIEKLGVVDAVVGVMGTGEGHDIVVFQTIEDFIAFVEFATSVDHDDDLAVPSHFTIKFVRGADVPPLLRKEIVERRWEVAAPDGYPMLVVMTPALVPRVPTAKEWTVAEGLALALAHVVTDKEALTAAFDGGEPLARTLALKTHAGELEITLRAPLEHPASAYAGPDDLIAELATIDAGGPELDDDYRAEIEEELIRQFTRSPEAKDLPDVHWCEPLMDLAANYVGVTIASIGAPELRELLFEHLPRKVSVDASVAAEIIDECRAFFAFLKREFALPEADACLRLLGEDGTKKQLAAALADPSNFGIAKSIMMSGREAGFDLATKEGVDAWMREIESKPLSPSLLRSLRLPPVAPVQRHVDPKTDRAKKNKRKAERKARKKNR